MKQTKTNFIARNFFESLKFVKDSRKYIYFAIWVFILFILIGLLFPAPAFFDSYIIDILKELINKTSGLSLFELIGFIFRNNFLVSVISIILGVLFCFVPIIIGISNGYLLGYVFRTILVKLGLVSGGLSLWKILPHGIFELPAIMISLGIGIRLGVSFFSSLNDSPKKNSFKNFFESFILAVKTLFFLILPLLVIAAIIEGSLIMLLGN